MNNKAKILAIALASGSAGALAVARSVMGTTDERTSNTELPSVSDLLKEAVPSDGLALELQTYKVGLEQNLSKLEESLKQLQEQETLVSQKDSLRREQYVQVDHLLACFKDAYCQGKSSGFPRVVFTQSYTQEQIEEMVQRLLTRKAELKGEDNQSLKQIKQAIAQLNSRIMETKRHIDNMPVYSALASAGAHAGKSDLVRTTLVSCLDTNHKFLEKEPSRYVSEHSRMAGVPPHEIPSAARFLAQSLPEIPRVPAGEIPTVSQLTTALREIVNERK